MEWRAPAGPGATGMWQREEKSGWGHAKLVVPASCVFPGGRESGRLGQDLPSRLPSLG